MKHLLLHHAETPTQENVDFSIIEYHPLLNLNVLRGTDTPAVNFCDQATETFTKAGGEGVDSDNNFKALLDTSTQTRVSNEDSDSDANWRLKNLLDTGTVTLVKSEATDSDKSYSDLEYLSETRTLTESGEALDSDR